MAGAPVRVLLAGLFLQGIAALEPSDQKPIIDEIQNDDKPLPSGTSGKIALYPGSRIFPTDLKAMNEEVKACPDDSSKAIELSPDVCLSGEYYVRDNLKVLETPKCADDSEPTMLFYQNRGCTGTPYLFSDEMSTATGECLWSEEQIPVPSYYWSVIFKCDLDAEVNEEANQIAEPPALIGEVFGPRDAKIVFHEGMFECHSDFANNRHPSEYGVDGCNWPLSSWGLTSVEVRTPAICPNGTRAQLALYEDFSGNWRNYKCLESKRIPNMRLIDIGDDMIKTCIDIKHPTKPKRAVGAQFYCDGLEYENGKAIIPEEKAPVPEAGMVSHRVCGTSTGQYQWAPAEDHPTFFYPKAGTCVKLPKAQQVRPYKNAICPDGTLARFAEWKNSDCNGWPTSIEGMDSSMFLNCESWSLKQETSYMFWCGTNGTAPEEKSDDDHRAVLTRNGCPKEKEDGWVSLKHAVGPTFERIEADTCINLRDSSRWKVFSSAKCNDGSTAQVALWTRGSCYGKPESIIDLSESPISDCRQACPDKAWSCSMSFWCDGIDQ